MFEAVHRRSNSLKTFHLQFRLGSFSDSGTTRYRLHTHRVIKKPFIGAETKLGQKHFSGVGREHAATQSVHTVRVAANHETVEVKVATNRMRWRNFSGGPADEGPIVFN
jgi:hypothetical protein